ncbi:IS3 family transposase [Streptomyces luteireticuli]|uniref:IS3 family transposase n=1 Tax=Streptomyces luteireticuli TaxID=173858 RepID=UPI003555D82F
MVMKVYSPEFKADAVALYLSDPDHSLMRVAKDLGVSRGTLRDWARAERSRRGEHSTTRKTMKEPAAVDETTREELEAGIAALRAELKAVRKENTTLATGRDILRKATKFFRRRDELVNRCRFIEDHHRAWGVKRLCQVLEVARSSFYKWRRGRAGCAERERADQALAGRIRGIHADSDGTYGAPRITAELRQAHGMRINEKKVARVMRKFGITGLHLRKTVRTTVPEPSPAPVPDLLQRDFTANTPNTKYVGDITYLPVGDGKFLYLATVLDLCSKRLAGWSIADHIRTELVTDALRAAARTRGGNLDGAIFHSDNGAQYCSKEFANACRELGVTRSRGAVGTSADNAAAESFNATMKRETLHGKKRWPGPREARLAVFRWVTRYNTRRRHSALAHTSPIDYEQRTATLAATA